MIRESACVVVAVLLHTTLLLGPSIVTAQEAAPTPRPTEERWIGVLMRKDASNVTLSANGATFELNGHIERQLLKEISKEVAVTGRTFDGLTIEVVKVEPIERR